MGKKYKILLLIDAIVNLVLGFLLILFPVGIAEKLGVPQADINFYPTILGGVIFGIGIALLVERLGLNHNIRGLGLGGAIVINLCGAGVLLVWLISTPLGIPLHGYIILWSIAVIVLLIGIIEIFAGTWIYK
ncbi:hypothetical protein JXQ31_13415 [candidate division KSB1 bacterium]|nr:hypothetical protein [candidate division KSB1 bacterium]